MSEPLAIAWQALMYPAVLRLIWVGLFDEDGTPHPKWLRCWMWWASAVTLLFLVTVAVRLGGGA